MKSIYKLTFSVKILKNFIDLLDVSGVYVAKLGAILKLIILANIKLNSWVVLVTQQYLALIDFVSEKPPTIAEDLAWIAELFSLGANNLLRFKVFLKHSEACKLFQLFEVFWLTFYLVNQLL